MGGGSLSILRVLDLLEQDPGDTLDKTQQVDVNGKPDMQKGQTHIIERLTTVLIIFRFADNKFRYKSNLSVCTFKPHLVSV